jgi:hypothetical protein
MISRWSKEERMRPGRSSGPSEERSKRGAAFCSAVPVIAFGRRLLFLSKAAGPAVGSPACRFGHYRGTEIGFLLIERSASNTTSNRRPFSRRRSRLKNLHIACCGKGLLPSGSGPSSFWGNKSGGRRKANRRTADCRILNRRSGLRQYLQILDKPPVFTSTFCGSAICGSAVRLCFFCDC